MTTGQRIAQKRKEAGLSQETLGAELGVSRQSIYKWESDTALPEIDKLVALSRRFGVTVGWLLGVEEAPETASAPDSGELTDAQLKMVEEITERYLAAQTAPKPRKKWPYVLAALAVLCAAYNIYDSIRTIGRQFDGVYNRINQMECSMSNQVYSISGQVEEILKQQNALTADYGTELVSADLSKNAVTFSVYAVPKTYVEGMRVEFSVDNGRDANSKTVLSEPDQNGQPVSDMKPSVLSGIRNREIGFIFQGFNLIPALTALENVELPLIYRGMPREERRRLAQEALVSVGLEKRMDHRPGEMSGGQQQRVAIARAVAAKPPIIMADEPTGNLDSASGLDIMRKLTALNEQGTSIILITHDNHLAQMAKRIVTIQDGRIISDTKGGSV